MSVYKDCMWRIENGSRFNINIKSKSVKVDGKLVICEGKENLIDTTDLEFVDDCSTYPYEVIEQLYTNYKTSWVGRKSNGSKPYFKALDSEETIDNFMMGENRNLAQYKLEAYIVCASLMGWLTWEDDTKWFWQGADRDLVILRDLIKGE